MTSTGADTARGPGARAVAAGSSQAVVRLLALAAALAVLIANLSGIATGDDGVGYRAIADSLLAGDGYAYFLEDPVTVWPPVWPALMAAVAWITPLDTLGAAIVLNAAVAAGVVLAGNRLLRVVVHDPRLVLAGTLVLALGPSTVGLGHVLMTDMAFVLVVTLWMLTLVHFRRTGSTWVLLGAAVWCWLGFGLRYVGLVLIAFGGLWLLLDRRRSWFVRVRDGALYGVVAVTVPIAWMLRNHAIDGTWTGERTPSARGLVDNGFDIAATLGRFLVPGLGNGLTKVWAAVGLLVLGVAVWLAWRVLRQPPGVLQRLWRMAGRPLGLLVGFGVLYLAYMLYVRTTTALNQLDLRLLYPAYLPLMFTALALLERVRRLDAEGEHRWRDRGVVAGAVWAVVNVVAGVVAIVAFALGHPYFTGNYEADVFDDVRANPVLSQLPEGCEVYSNLPNALYPTLGSEWSPRRTALESNQEVDDLAELTPTLSATPACLVWIDEEPTYGHLWTLEQLEQRLELQPLASDGNVTTYRMLPSAS